MEIEGSKKFISKLEKIEIVCLDTSILIYHLEDIHPYNILTKILLEKIASGDIACNISTLTITELLTKPYKMNNTEKVSIFEDFIQSLPNTKTVDVTYDIAKNASRIRAAYNLRTPDAILLATASLNKRSCFITNDISFKNKNIKEITILVLNDYL